MYQQEMDRLKISNISVIQPAVVPRKPIGLPKTAEIPFGSSLRSDRLA